MQEEAEAAFVTTASTMRGVQNGNSIRHLTRRSWSDGDYDEEREADGRGRSRARASDPETDLDEEREQQYDLLTAALIGAAVGAGITLLLRRGPSGRRPIGPLVRYAGGVRPGGMAGSRARSGRAAAGSKALAGRRARR